MIIHPSKEVTLDAMKDCRIDSTIIPNTLPNVNNLKRNLDRLIALVERSEDLDVIEVFWEEFIYTDSALWEIWDAKIDTNPGDLLLEREFLEMPSTPLEETNESLSCIASLS